MGWPARNSRRARSAEWRGARASLSWCSSGSGRGRQRKRRASSMAETQVCEAAGSLDEVQQVAILSRRGIRPAPGRIPGGGQAHVEAPTRIVADIADDPVMALAFAVPEIGPAPRLGMRAQVGREAASRLVRAHDDATEAVG